MSTDTVIASLQEKIDDLNQQAWEARVNDSPKAFQLSQESVNLARSINYAKGLAEGLRSLGFGYVRLFKNDEAAPLLRESLSLFQSINDVKGQAIVYEYLGIIERNWGNLGTSLELLLKGYALILQVGSLEIEVTSCYQIGVTYKHLGNHENALDYLYRALSIAKKSNNALMEAYATNIIGSIYFDNGDYKDALDCYQQGLVIRRESHDKWGEAGSLDNIGFTYLKLNDVDKAIDYCKQSLEITQSTGDKKGEANTLLHLGEIFQLAGDIGQASKFSNESLAIRKARGDKRGEAEVLLFLADLHKDRGDVEDNQIFEWLSGALRIADEIKAQDLLSKAYYNLHEYHTQRGNHRESLIQLEAHLQIEKELHKHAINQKISNLEISHKAEVISQRNKELIELNEKIEKANAELKIEASLERVRAVAMGMKEPADMINVCRMISDQLRQLEFKEIRNVQTVIIYPQKHEYLNYQYFIPYDKEVIETIDYRLHPDVLEFTNQMLSSADAYYTKTFEGEELKVWREYRKQTNQLPDPRLDLTSSSHYYFYSIGSGALGVTTYAPLSHEQINLFKRFRNVFELAYRRFIDIEKALAQAREAQIQLALERVRARTMAMHHSEELSEVVKLLYQECDKLKINNESTDIEIGLIDEATGIASIWAHFYLSDGSISTFKLPFTQFEEINGEFKKWKATPVEKRNELFFTTEFSAEQWRRYVNIIEKLPELAEIFRPLIEAKITKWVTHNAYFSHGILTLQGTEAYSQETQDIQKRFAKVFEQTYTRFLDLKKAEAQTREAQIEAALERVRAKSMAMHHSDDLIKVINVVQEQLLGLGFHFHAANFVTDYNEKGYTMWLASPGESFPYKIYVPQAGLKYFEAVDAAIEKGSDFATYTLSFEEKNNYFRNLFENSLAKNTSDEGKRTVYESKGMAASVVLLDKIRLNLMNLDMIPYTDEENDILKRFGYVFEQSYIRFLDLKKAEAQAKEAQTEVALERIRARAMAMHSSNELVDVARILREQMGLLDQPDLETSVINLFEEDSDYIHSWHAFREPGSSSGKSVNGTVSFRKDSSELTKEMIDHYHYGEKEFTLEARGKKLNEFLQVLINSEPEISNYIGKNPPEKVFYHFATFTGGALLTVSYQPTTEEIKSLQRRAASVFDMAYRRYRDLKKAEAQAREAQIEAGLERVRSKTMAMHKSEEVTSVAVSLNEELLKLGFEGGSTIIIINKETGDTEQWTGFSEDSSIKSCNVPYFKHPCHDALLNAWKSGDKFLVYTVAGDEKKSLDEHYFTTGYKIFPENDKKWMREMESVTFSHAFMKYGAIHWGPGHLTEEQLRILQRFSKVFEQSYTRFLDLQKAEAQAREAQIETALERVRSRTMGMQRSGELPEAANLLFQQIQSLGVNVFSTGYNIWESDKKSVTSWMSSQGIIQPPFKLRLDEEAALIDCYKAAQQGDTFFVQQLSGERLISHLNYMSTLPVIGEVMKKMREAGISLPGYMINHHAFFSHGYLLFITYEQVPEAHDIFKRFAKVFEQTYTRFLDLQKAEAQAREAQIELGLEKVRAKAMAMHKSDDLKMAVATVFEELDKLNIGILRCGIAIMDKEKPRADVWITVKSEQTNTIQVSGDESLDYHPLLRGAYDGWVKQEDFSYVLQGEDLLSYYRDVASMKYQLPVSTPFDKEKIDQQQYYFNAVFQDGSLFAFMETAFTDEAKTVMKRFANVFNLTYKRFLDLQKAEAQAREAQIELGLERVRARAMAMQKSDELKELIATVSTELSKLDLILDRCFIMTYDIKTLGATWWMANPETSSDPIGLYVKYHEQAPNLAFLKAWQDRVLKWQYILEGSVKKNWDEFLFVETELARLPRFVIDNMKANEKVYLSASFNNFGCLTLATLEPLSDEQFDIMLRFAKVFDLTYTRFNDLKQAEAQTRAAKIEAALERVRARALAMQEPEELKDVAQVLRTEMGLLGVEELETCSIYINDESAEKAECWYALKDISSDEKKLVNDHFALNLNDTWVGREMLRFYQSPAKQISIVMQGENRREWILYCEKHSAPLRGHYGEVIPDRTYHLYKFSHGAIGAAAAGDISEESWRMLGRAASVFTLAYSRFKDLTQARTDLVKLKEEKKRAEDALTELQATQKQLIQSEKMASLGELTAGIAHEIQNPLNFVNNFSDVSNELLEEMKQELATGNTQQAIELVNGVKENLEKILHHGKRADAIVKGMLQHSRSSSGQKELTDINTLAEEYLRLAYHGLRAKDKFFNAKFETDLDWSIGKINVVPQEMGRVILNLINNSFYAVSEKKRMVSNGYEPMVTVSTKVVKPPPAGGGVGVIEIRVKDNGNGIPQKDLDKIFQPFFTTKPTGQGTGLGLSLSYDIVTKGHDGEIKVETKEGEGTAFIISLPMK